MSALTAARQALLGRVLEGDRRSIARILTCLDDDVPDQREIAAFLAARTGRALVVGVTGVPGGGKSTLVSAMLGVWLARGLRVAVIAVDPSSPVSGGAVLGDRIRMGVHGAHPHCFIRSLSARGQLGGLSRAARGAVDCFDAAGYDRVIVETVGAGQSETAIASLADTRIVVCPPGLGDDVQAIKAGILEIADVLAVSKGDLPLAQETAREMREMLTLRKATAGAAWKPRVMVVCGAQGQGVAELVAAIEAHAATVPSRRAAAVPSEREAATPPRTGAGAGAHDEDTACRARLAEFIGRDGLCTTLGIRLVDGGAGRAAVAMTIDPRHINFNGGCHGGAIFALADTAFGLASNSRGTLAMGIDAHVTFQVGVRAGEELVARSSELMRSRRIAMYKVDVVRRDAGLQETAVSSFTGTVYLRAASRPGTSGAAAATAAP